MILDMVRYKRRLPIAFWDMIICWVGNWKTEKWECGLDGMISRKKQVKPPFYKMAKVSTFFSHFSSSFFIKETMLPLIRSSSAAAARTRLSQQLFIVVAQRYHSAQPPKQSSGVAETNSNTNETLRYLDRLKDLEMEFQSQGEYVSADFWKTEPGKHNGSFVEVVYFAAISDTWAHFPLFFFSWKQRTSKRECTLSLVPLAFLHMQASSQTPTTFLPFLLSYCYTLARKVNFSDLSRIFQVIAHDFLLLAHVCDKKKQWISITESQEIVVFVTVWFISTVPYIWNRICYNEICKSEKTRRQMCSALVIGGWRVSANECHHCLCSRYDRWQGTIVAYGVKLDRGSLVEALHLGCGSQTSAIFIRLFNFFLVMHCGKPST